MQSTVCSHQQDFPSKRVSLFFNDILNFKQLSTLNLEHEDFFTLNLPGYFKMFLSTNW